MIMRYSLGLVWLPYFTSFAIQVYRLCTSHIIYLVLIEGLLVRNVETSLLDSIKWSGYPIILSTRLCEPILSLAQFARTSFADIINGPRCPCFWKKPYGFMVDGLCLFDGCGIHQLLDTGRYSINHDLGI